MRRVIVVGLLMSLVVLVLSIGAAAESLVNENLQVEATIAKHAEIRFPEGSTIVINFDGTANEEKSGYVLYEVSTNTKVKVTAEGQGPLLSQDESCNLTTEFRVYWGVPPSGSWQSGGSIPETIGYNGKLRKRWAWVQGTLGDVHDQPAGIYSTAVVLTVSAAN